MENQEIIITTIPKVIIALFRENDPALIRLIAEKTEKTCGQKPDPEIVRQYLNLFYQLINKPVKTADEAIPAILATPQNKPLRPESHPGVRENKTLEEILEVLDLVYNKETKLTQAYKIVAARRGIKPETVRDKCERRMGWKAAELRRKIDNPEELKKSLLNRFPSMYKEIREFFGGI